MWSEEASDSLFALPEASLLPLIIAKWKCRLCFQPGIALSALQLWSCKEILFLHPSKDTQQATRIFLSCITVIYCVCSWMKSSTITVFSMKWTSSQSIQCLLDHFRFQVKWLDFYELILSYLSGLCQDAPSNCVHSLKSEKAGNGIPLRRSFQKITDEFRAWRNTTAWHRPVLQKSAQNYGPPQGHSPAWVVSYRRLTDRETDG